MKDLIFIYDYCKLILKYYVSQDIPAVITNAKTYYGKIHIHNDEPVKISLSKFNLYVSDWEDDDIKESIDTVCHEFAHICVHEHNEYHEQLTNLYKDLCFDHMEILKNMLND